MSLDSVARQIVAAALVVQGFGPAMQQAAAGTASAAFEVRAQVSSVSACRASGVPVSLACGSPQAPVILQARPDHTGLMLEDGWITYGTSTEVYDSVYAA